LVYAVYKSSRKKGKLPFTCSTPEEVLVHNLTTEQITSRSNSGSLLTFRLALSCNGEYANYFGATSAAQSALVLAQFNATMTRVNGVFEKDFAIHMNIVPQTTNVIYYDAATDPYTTMSNWNTQLQQALNTTLTGTGTTITANNAAYDIGHMFGSTGGGGNAGCIGCVCVDGVTSGAGSTKGRGITSPADGVPMGDTFDIDYVVHEMGHQFGANHTFSHNAEGAGVNVEVGGGVTIMGYAGITNYNTHMNSIDIFHAVSIAQVQANMVGKTCPTVTAITHSAPVVSAGADYTVPLSTPFVLTGSATDAGGTSLMTYTWEQNDNVGSSTGANSPASPTKTEGPNFACYTDASIPVRYFPVFSSTLNGSTTTAGVGVTAEALSSVARTLNFRLTARDNVNGQGQTGFDDMVVTVANKTALTITVPANTSYPVGSSQTVVWTGATGANGHQTIAGGANVDISFSADNGVTWTTLVTNTPNDGSQAVTLPAGVAAPFCRFMVKANANIFFNVSPVFSVGYSVTNTCNTYSGTAMPIITASGFPANQIGTVNVPMTGNISSIAVFNNITHSYLSDVITDISSPTNPNTYVKAYNRFCGNTNGSLNLKMTTSSGTLDCGAGAATQQTVASGESFTVFNGQNPQGNWTLRAYDTFNGDDGTLNSWAIEICTQAITLTSEDFTINDLAIYPNPNNGNFNVQFTSNSSNEINVGVHDMRGREIFTKTYTNNGLFNENLQLNNVQTGIYMVTIQDGSSKVTKKIVVE
jgi:subtilisin-like proprotein convertase family protein